MTNNVTAAALIALALAIGAMGIYVADADDAPGAAVIGLLLMIGAVVLGVKAARNRLPAWAARTALAVGVVLSAFAAFLTHAVAVTGPLFAQPQDLTSVIDSAPPPRDAAAVERAREVVRAASTPVKATPAILGTDSRAACGPTRAPPGRAWPGARRW